MEKRAFTIEFKMCSRVSFFKTLYKYFMKFGLSIVSRNLLSSFFNFQTLQRVIHLSGVNGAQFLHSASNMRSVLASSLSLAFNLDTDVVALILFPLTGGALTGKGVRDWMKIPFLKLFPS